MSLRKDLISLQFANATPNTVLGWNNLGVPFHMPAFTGATVSVAGSIGLVPAPIANQHNLFLRGDGTWAVAGSGGGSGTINGSGTSGRLTLWTGTTDIGDNVNLTYDITNSILKTQTINLSRTGLPGSGIADGDFVFDTNQADFRGRIDTQWTNFTKTDEIILPAGTTNITLDNSYRNKNIVTSASTTVTINVTSSLVNKFACTITKGGTGNVVISGFTTFNSINNTSTITIQHAVAYIYHIGGNVWRGVGALGNVGFGTVTSVQLGNISNFLTVSSSPIIGSGVITANLNNQNAETVLIGPASGSSATTPTFRALTRNSLPAFEFVDGSGSTITISQAPHRFVIIDVIGSGNHNIQLNNVISEIGWWCHIFRSKDAGTTTITAGSGVIIDGVGSANPVVTAGTMATIIYRGSGRFQVIGDLT